MSTRVRRVFTIITLVSVSISLCGGCQDLKYHRIYMSAIAGAAIGAIVGHQSDECGAGAAVGAGVFAAGELLHQIDDLPKQKKLEKAADEVARGESLFDLTRTE